MQTVEQCTNSGALTHPGLPPGMQRQNINPATIASGGVTNQAARQRRLRATVQKAPFFYPKPKEHHMKIIVTGNPANDVPPTTYEADRWEANLEGYLYIFNKDKAVVGTHAPGMWAHVRGYAEEH